MKQLLGFQLANAKGENIQGDDDDPTSLASFEIMGIDMAIQVIAQLPKGYLLMPIYDDGTIEEPTIV